MSTAELGLEVQSSLLPMLLAMQRWQAGLLTGRPLYIATCLQVRESDPCNFPRSFTALHRSRPQQPPSRLRKAQRGAPAAPGSFLLPLGPPQTPQPPQNAPPAVPSLPAQPAPGACEPHRLFARVWRGLMGAPCLCAWSVLRLDHAAAVPVMTCPALQLGCDPCTAQQSVLVIAGAR